MLAAIRSRWDLQLRSCFLLYCWYYDNVLYSLQTARPEGRELPKNYIAKTSGQAPASCCSVRGEDMTGFFHDYSVVQCACAAVVTLRALEMQQTNRTLLSVSSIAEDTCNSLFRFHVVVVAEACGDYNQNGRWFWFKNHYLIGHFTVMC